MSVANPTPVLVVGAGIMGSGIAQVAAQAGHPVWLHDARTGAAREACHRLADSLQGLVERGRMNTDTAADQSASISVHRSIEPSCDPHTAAIR